MSSRDAVFDDVRTRVMGDAFDAICAKLHGTDYSHGVKEAIASHIIDVERATAEQDPHRLAGAVVASLGIKL